MEMHFFFSHRDTEAQTKEIIFTKPFSQDFPGGLMVKNLPENAGNTCDFMSNAKGDDWGTLR